MTTQIFNSNIKAKTIIIGCIFFLVLFPHYISLPFYSYAPFCYLLIHLYLKHHGLNIGSIGLTKQGFSFKAFVIGLCTGLIWLGFILWVYIPLAANFSSGQSKGYTEYNFLIGNLPAYLMTVAAAWIVGGLYEELAFRGFIRFGIARVFASAKYVFYVSIICSAILFGLYHIQQGVLGVISATLGGLYWTMIVLKNKGNLWTSIFSHAVYDTAALTMIYLDIFPGQH